MMFKDVDQQTLQSLIKNGTITVGSQKIPKQVLDVTGTTIKSEDELLSDVHQLPNEGIHGLNICITTLISPVQMPPPQNPGNASTHGPATCCEIP